MNKRHGYRGTPTYSSWAKAKYRCSSKNKWYAQRGITMCERWRNDFVEFLKDMGDRPQGHTLDRVDNNLGYEPGNCRWSTHKEQCNNRRNNVILSFKGETLNLTEWSKKTGIARGTLWRRLRVYKFSIEKVLSSDLLK